VETLHVGIFFFFSEMHVGHIYNLDIENKYLELCFFAS
jgi:hypothetical protein